jgi:hypothetical protein
VNEFHCVRHPGACREVRCDECPVRLHFIPKKPVPYEAGWLEPTPTPFNQGVHLKDSVYHPRHYSQWKMEPIEFIAINDLPWWLANVIKYTMRFNMKDGLQDLYKARSYLDMKIRQVEGHLKFWEKPVSVERALSHTHYTDRALTTGWDEGLRAAAQDDAVHHNAHIEGETF